jgi:adenylosuccinate synthase
MPVTIVVGGQYGSEGKGKVAHFLTVEMGASIAVRVGGPNSGHTVMSSGRPLIFRQLPTAAILPDVVCVLPAGSYIDPDLLQLELALAKLAPERLVIDPNAVIVGENDIARERDSILSNSIGSTGSGTGSAVITRIERTDSARLANNHPALKQYIRDSGVFIRDRLNRRERILIEGTQGFGLSLLHSPHYPYVTSRDTTASAFASEAGVSPLDVDDVVMVIRAFPIRVGGNSGPLPHEIDWEKITIEGQHRKPLVEFTSVTKKIRRVARFDPDIVRTAIRHDNPTRIVLNHLDYLDGCTRELTPATVRFVRDVEEKLAKRVDFLGLGPDITVPANHPLRARSSR